MSDPAFDLLPPNAIARFRATGRQEDVENPIVIAKFFTPWTYWTWYATEAYWIRANGDVVEFSKMPARPADVVDVHFFGLAVGHETELGYFSLEELLAVRGFRGLVRIERDLHLREGYTLKDAREQHARRDPPRAA